MNANGLKIMLLVACAVGMAGPRASAAGLVTMEPGPVDFSGSIGGRVPEDGRMLQTILPGAHAWFVNEDFPASGYRISCDTPYVMARSMAAGAGQSGIAAEHRVCRIEDAPVVGADFLSVLKRNGYEFAVSYPFKDAGSGRALVFWSDGGSSRGMAPAHQGFARIGGMGWKNQFGPAARCDGVAPGCAWRYYDHGDSFGSFINRFPSPDRESAARVFQQIGVDASGNVVAGASIVVDAWLTGEDGDPEVAALPSGSRSASAAGAASPASAAADRCAQTTSGEPRSPVWIENCIADEARR